MRKTSTILISLILLSISSFAQEWVSLGSLTPTAPEAVLLSDSQQETVVHFSLTGFNKESVNTPNGPQHLITVPKMASMMEEGAPDLPLYAIPIQIDDATAMEISIKDAKYQDFDNIEIAPSKGNLSRKIDPKEVPFRYGDVYSHNSFFPEHPALLDEPYILRDFRGQNILVFPFAYNPVSKTLRVYSQLTLCMTPTSDQGHNPKLSRKSNSIKMSREMESLYRHRFLNFKEKAAKYTFIPDVGEMLVICPDQFMAAMQAFVDWKNQSGRPTTLVSLSDIGGDNDTQIKNYIRSIYDNPERNLTYILIVGDIDTFSPHSMSGEGSDIWFGQLEGNDHYPEVFVGRFSVESEADVQNHVSKVLYYERDIPANVTWLDDGMGIGSTEGGGNGHNGGESDYQHIEYIRDTLLHYTYETVSQHYQGVGIGTNANMMSENFNNGVGICNYCNHGSQTSWSIGSFSNNNVNALTNDYKWPFIWSTACSNGQFSGNCFAEAWMRATNSNTGAPTGAIGGMFSWSSQPWQPPMTGQDEMVDILCGWRSADQFHHTLAGASLNGNMKILDLHPGDHGFTHNTWILFGDPSLLLRTENPTEMNVTCQPEAIFLGQTTLLLTADADYAIATLSLHNNVLYTTEIINGEGILTFSSPEETGTALLVVTSYNKVTEVHDIEIIPSSGPFLTFGGFDINDVNHQADYGETVGFDLTLKNLGNEPVSNVQVNLSTDSPYVEIIDGLATLSSIEAFGEFTITNGFEIKVNDLISDGIQANFTIVCSDATHTWTSHFRMTLHAPALSLAEFRPISTAHSGIVDTLLVSVRNVGSADAHNANIQLHSSSLLLEFNQIEHSIGNIPAGGTATALAIFTPSQEIPSGSSFEVFYLMNADAYTFSGTEMVNIGPIKETFETGDFSAFDWMSLGGTEWFIDNSTANTGNFSARSGAITHANLTTLQVEINVLQDGQISFFKKISSEANKDKLTFYIDNTIMDIWSGEVNWSRETYPVTAGTHKFRWIYMKDSSGTYGDDCCWIDDIQFPSSHIVTLLPAFAVDAQVDLNEVTLSWISPNPNYNYIVRRDGEQISVQHETSFTELLPIGTYIYSVTAFNDIQQLSVPTFVKVVIDTLGTKEIMFNAELFPNPAHDLLNVSLGQPFSYAIYNSLGQMISVGKSAGALQLHCSGMVKGLYFIQFKTDSEVFVKKFIVR